MGIFGVIFHHLSNSTSFWLLSPNLLPGKCPAHQSLLFFLYVNTTMNTRGGTWQTWPICLFFVECNELVIETHLKNMLVQLDHFPKVENKICLKQPRFLSLPTFAYRNSIRIVHIIPVCWEVSSLKLTARLSP